MNNKKELEQYKKELDKINKLIDRKTKNLIYLLKNCNIEDINLLQFNFVFSDLINKRTYLENIIFDLEY